MQANNSVAGPLKLPDCAIVEKLTETQDVARAGIWRERVRVRPSIRHWKSPSNNDACKKNNHNAKANKLDPDSEIIWHIYRRQKIVDHDRPTTELE